MAEASSKPVGNVKKHVLLSEAVCYRVRFVNPTFRYQKHSAADFRKLSSCLHRTPDVKARALAFHSNRERRCSSHPEQMPTEMACWELYVWTYLPSNNMVSFHHESSMCTRSLGPTLVLYFQYVFTFICLSAKQSHGCDPPARIARLTIMFANLPPQHIRRMPEST